MAAAFDDLLTVQAHDLAADRLRHRRATLAERDELAGREAARAQLEAKRAEVAVQRDEVLREERRLEDEARGLGDKASAEEARMYSGTVSSPKELQAMASDVEHLRRRVRELEDVELEVLERREAFDADIAVLDAAMAGIDEEIARLGAAIAAEESAIDAEMAEEVGAREAAVTSLPPAILTLYEEVRAANRGVGAARLVGSNCQACHLALPATEVDRIRHMPPDAVARCEHCGAILVR